MAPERRVACPAGEASQGASWPRTMRWKAKVAEIAVTAIEDSEVVLVDAA